MKKAAIRNHPLLISTAPLWLFAFDLLLEVTFTTGASHAPFHVGLVGISAVALFLLLRAELHARHTAEETLRKEHESLEATVRRRAMEYAGALHHESVVLEAIMENTRTMLAYLDPQMNFVRVNSAYVNGCGHTRQELLGRNHFALFPDAENETLFRKARETGEPVSFLAKPFEFQDQPWRGVTYWDWTLVPVKGVDGSVCGLVFSLRDVTQEHRAMKQREEHLGRLNALIKVSVRTLRERTAENLFQSIADAAREITDARVSVAGHGYTNGNFNIQASSRAGDAPSCPPGRSFASKSGGLYDAIMETDGTLRLTDEDLRTHPRWRGLPDGHYPLRGLLGVHMKAGPVANDGFIMVSDKQVGEFNNEDEALLSELAALASLSLQHINARADAEHHAAHLNAIFGAMTNAVIVYDAAGIAIRANPAAIHMMGFDPVGHPLHSVLTRLRIHDDDGRAYELSDLPSHRALAGEDVIGKRLIMNGADGVERIIRSSSTPLRLGKTFLGAVTVWIDETERERLVRQLELERAKLKAVIDNAPEGIVVVDKQGLVQLANPAAERLSSRPAAAGDSIERNGAIAFVHEDGTPYNPAELPFARSAVSGEEHRDVEMQIQRHDGKRRHLLTNSAPIRDSSGAINGAVGMFQDITQRKHDEEALRQQEREYHLLMEQASDGIVIVDDRGNIRGANSQACELLGFTREELMLINGSHLVPPDDLASLVTAMRTTAADKALIAEHRLRRKDGTLVSVETSARRLSDGRYQAIVRDISDRKKAEEEFVRAVKTQVFDRLFGMLREFQHGEVLAMNLHRIALFARNLNALSGDATLNDDPARARLETAVNEYKSIAYQKLLGIASLLRTVENEINAAATVQIERVSGSDILALAEHLKTDTDKLLGIVSPRADEISRRTLEMGGAQIAEHAETLSRKINDITRLLIEQFTSSLPDVAASVAHSFRALSPDVSIELAPHSGDLKALIKPSELAEVLSLLIGNALDSLAVNNSLQPPRQKHITIRFAEQDARIRIEVEDTGTGIPPHIRERIFERGFTTKGEGHGHGLGYARDHVSAYGGTLTFEEPAQGGARFVLNLVRTSFGDQR